MPVSSRREKGCSWPGHNDLSPPYPYRSLLCRYATRRALAAPLIAKADAMKDRPRIGFCSDRAHAPLGQAAFQHVQVNADACHLVTVK